MIDLVGHFGSRLSYASISAQLCAALDAGGVLGNISNLDDKFIDAAHVRPPIGRRGDRVLLLTDPRSYLVEATVSAYGAENVAIFLCPNTDKLSDEHIRACGQVGRIYTPSTWCSDTIYESCQADRIADVVVMPLGVDIPFTEHWCQREVEGRPRLLHVTTDTFWPGRKGTGELLHAWALGLSEIADLTVHCLPALYGAVHQELGALDLLGKVRLLCAPARGTTAAELFELVAGYNMLVAPSRSEGFGLMPLSALLCGTPVLTTADTGQRQYLDLPADDEDGPALGGWMQVPTYGWAPLAGEHGDAPVVRADQLAWTIRGAVHDHPDLLALTAQNEELQSKWSWWARRAHWAASLKDWSKGG